MNCTARRVKFMKYYVSMTSLQYTIEDTLNVNEHNSTYTLS